MAGKRSQRDMCYFDLPRADVGIGFPFRSLFHKHLPFHQFFFISASQNPPFCLTLPIRSINVICTLSSA
ncbi:hypothetical protein TcWFU_004875 [Taenia crassiceps]|uniref:Uncharacterized protein n=1 Tax=Taenia crassiceps TaxID=6207 RepID=A0ABR4QH47_9CEST